MVKTKSLISAALKVMFDYDEGDEDKKILRIERSYPVVNSKKLDYLNVFDKLNGLCC